MEKFTEREKEVINYIIKGYNNKKIGSKMFTTVHTVKAHMTSVMKKLGVSNRTEAACKILKEKLTDSNEQ
ncbi:response regulator transcription factor [bacterium]|nr:response regulator transcription factor [bacterium]